jgi:hypothetical protein
MKVTVIICIMASVLSYSLGVYTTNKHYQGKELAAIKTEMEVRRTLDLVLSEISRDNQNQLAEIRSEVQPSRTVIREIIKEVPIYEQCVMDQVIIDHINKVRGDR